MKIAFVLAVAVFASGTVVAPAYAQQQQLPRVAIYGFDTQGLSPWWGQSGFDPGDAISDIMTDQLVNNGSYNVIDRTHIQQVLAEQNLSRPGDVSPSTEAQLGRMLGANFLIFGRIIQFDKTGGNTGGLGALAGGLLGGVGVSTSKVTLHVNIRIVEASTGRIAATVDDEESKSGTSFAVAGIGGSGGAGYSSSSFTNSTIGQLITLVAANIVKKIDPTRLVAAPPAPTISAKVLGVDGASIFINAGTVSGVAVGTYFTLYEVKSFKDPDTGKLLESHEKRGSIQIISVDADTAVGKLVDGDPPHRGFVAISGGQ